MVTLKEGRIIDSWSQLIEGGQGEAEGFFQSAEQYLATGQAPGMTWKRESVAPGMLKGLFGKRRDFLMVTDERFDDYMVCIGPRPYGNFLDVSWFWSGSKKAAIVDLLGKIPGAALGVNAYSLMQNLDVFDQQDLTAFVDVTRAAARKATHTIIAKLNIDPTRINWTTRGTGRSL
jgi:hypothetical protein